MKLDYLATEEEIANMIKTYERIARGRGHSSGYVSSYRYDQTLRQLYKRYLEFRDTSMRPVYIHVLIERTTDVEEDLQLEIDSFNENICLFTCNGRLVGEYSDYIVSMYTIIPDTKSELAKEALRRCE